MGVKKGLSVNGVVSLAECITNPSSPASWMKAGAAIGAMTGNYNVVNVMSGLAGMAGIEGMFMGFGGGSGGWTIGGMAFDGILRTDHASHVRTTQYPVQTGVTMTDHAIVEPAELTIDIMMTDAAVEGAATNIMQNLIGGLGGGIGGMVAGIADGLTGGKVSKFMNKANNVLGAIGAVSNIVEMASGLTAQKFSLKALVDELVTAGLIAQPGAGRSIAAWGSLKQMQLERQPVTVVTRLQTYENMIIEDLTAPDDYMTLNALKCTVHLRQIIFANVAEVKESERPCTNGETAGGQVPAQNPSNDKSAAKAIADTMTKH